MSSECPDGFWCLQLRDMLNSIILVITLIVIYLGPLRANLAANQQVQRNDAKRRKLETLGSLMKTRKIFLSPEHVMALNVVQLEFMEDEKVINAYKAYIKYRNSQSATVSEQYLEEADEAYFDLIHAIAIHLELKFDKADLQRYSYAPQGWANDESQLRHVRALLIEVLNGQKPLYTINANPTPAIGKFPVAPAAE